MAPLPFNNTNVLFVDYTTGVNDHTLLCRFDGDDTGASAMTAVDAFLTALSPLLGDTTIIGARVQLLGTNVSSDVTWSGATGYGDGGGTPSQDAIYVDFVGRSPAGRRVRAAMFGFEQVAVGANYRASRGETAEVDDALDLLMSFGDSFLAIDGTVPVWKQYANVGVNAYWRNKNR